MNSLPEQKGSPSLLPSSPTPSFPYRVVAKVGEGGMGEVFRAEDIELGRSVAIKTLRRDFVAGLAKDESEEAVRRFLQEARAAASLSHPGVAVVYRIGTENDWPYIAMEWLQGQTLAQLLTQYGKLSVVHAARLGLQVLAALDAAHRAGIVHRDVKPANLVVTDGRRVKVTDFGIARIQGGGLTHTRTGAFMGTPQYAAPEQFTGRPVDARTDLYALGTVLYELVSGRPPFEAGSLLELAELLRDSAPPSLVGVVAGVSRSLDEFLQRALAKRPEQRFSSALEMSQALQPFSVALSARGSSPAFSQPSLPRPPEVATVADAHEGQVFGLVASVIRTWRTTDLGHQKVETLLDRLLEKPVHTSAFCGAVKLGESFLLLRDGVLCDAFDPAFGQRGDPVMESLPRTAEATLWSCPDGVEPRLVGLLASLLATPAPRVSELDASFADVPQLLSRLASEGFDGAVRLTRASGVAFIVFSWGKRVLDVFGGAWPRDPRREKWEDWIADVGASVSVEDRRTAFPSATFRRRLRELPLDVVRPKQDLRDSIRVDTRKEAYALTLQPKLAASDAVTRSASTASLVASDPAVAAARWALAHLPRQFVQYQRTSQWKALVQPLAEIETVLLHHMVALKNGRHVPFDAATFSTDGRMIHALSRVAVGTASAVRAFIANVVAAKELGDSGRHLTGAILLSTEFSEDALDAYLDALRSSRLSLRGSLDALTHREGFLRTARGGVHVLLVEETGEERRPLVPEN